MFPVIAVTFLLVPIVEIYLLIQVGQVIGALWTVFLVVLTAVIGVWLLKIQGMSTLQRAQQKMQNGQMPAQEMLEGLGLVLAGAFLLTPGFFTDTIGFLLLLPPTRVWLVGKLVARMMASGQFVGQSSVHGYRNDTSPGEKGPDRNVIEGVNYKRED
jgi:UPF0716 protein FxsA